MILFIHGFAGSSSSTKGQILKEYFKEKAAVLVPDVPEEPEKAFSLLIDKIKSSKDEKNLIIGSSLGGFYALMLLSKFKDISTVLINPALYPYEQLKSYIGEKITRNNGTIFEWKEKYIEQLKKIKEESDKNINFKNILLLLSTDDELIDYKETINILGETGKTIVLDNAGHEFSRFEEVLNDIENFYGI